jgi:hypothetical protein
MVEYAYIVDFASVLFTYLVSVTRVKPAKTDSANVLSESQVIYSTVMPLPAAAWKRRKSFTVTRSGASTFFRENQPSYNSFIGSRKALLKSILYSFVVLAEILHQYRSF